MPALSVDPVFFTFTDVDGQPLEAGDIYVGVSGLDPITNPINVYWDAALSQLATQPIKTRGGYPLNGSAIGRLYVNSDYSIKVASRAGNVVYSATAAGERISSDLVTFIQAGTGAVQRTAQSKMRDVVSVLDFGAVGDGVTNDTTAVQAAINTGYSLYFPAGTYMVNNLTQSTTAQRFIADSSVTISKNANGPILTSSGDSVEINGIRFVGAGYTGDNLVMTGSYVRLINCGSRDAAGRALKATGDAVQIWGSNPIWATTDATASGYDIEMGVSGTTRGYNQLYGVYTSQATGGILMTDCGVPWIIGGQFGKLNFASGTGPAGAGGLICVGARILGNVTVGLSGCTFTSNRVGVVSITFSAGTSGQSFDQSNILSTGATITNSGNANNLIIRETSTGSVSALKIGADASNAVMEVYSGNGDTGEFGFQNGVWVNNNKAFRAKDSGGTLQNVAYISTGNVNFLANGNGDTVLSAGTLLVLAANGNGRWGVETNYLYPRADNAYSLGLGSYRPTVIYAVSGTINTSDAREKQQVRLLSDAERAAAVKCKSLIRAFKWNDAVEKKGDKARIHFGVMAQDVQRVFEEEKLDPWAYGLFCYDQWDKQQRVVETDQDGNEIVVQEYRAAGNRYGVRYDQLLAFIISAL